MADAEVEAMGEVVPPLLTEVALAGVVGVEGAPDAAESVRERVDSFLSRSSLLLLKSALKGFDMSRCSDTFLVRVGEGASGTFKPPIPDATRAEDAPKAENTEWLEVEP